MRKSVRILHEARLDLRDIALFHRQKVEPISAQKITDEILDGLEALGEFPEMGFVPPYEMLSEIGYRVTAICGYLCFYRIEGEEVVVIRILHGRTDYLKKLF